MTTTRRRGIQLAALLGFASLLTFAAYQIGRGAAPADDVKTSKEVEVQLHASLRQVINQGADLYNVAKDYAGCYYTYKGSLVTIRPLLGSHPDLQKLIDKSMQESELEPHMWQRTFTLRKTLDAIRAKIDPNPGKVVDKKGDEKKVDDKKSVDDKKAKVDDKKPKVDDKKVDDKKALDKKIDKKPAEVLIAPITGKVTYKGQPLAEGFVTFVAKDMRKYSANLTAGGVYTFKKGLPPGEYTVIIDPPAGVAPTVALPARYRNPELSPLLVLLVESGLAWDFGLN